jgi:hypothetical protein
VHLADVKAAHALIVVAWHRSVAGRQEENLHAFHDALGPYDMYRLYGRAAEAVPKIPCPDVRV